MASVKGILTRKEGIETTFANGVLFDSTTIDSIILYVSEMQ